MPEGIAGTKKCGLGYSHEPHHFDPDDEWGTFMCPGYVTPNRIVMAGSDAAIDLAFDYMQKCGLDPTPDAVGQLSGPFLECLKIMCERPYDPDGATWRAEGWRGMIWKSRDKITRMWHNGWTKGRFVNDDALDAINYLGFYLRIRGENGSEWGERGRPGNGEGKIQE
jgi:hypothetical protein